VVGFAVDDVDDWPSHSLCAIYGRRACQLTCKRRGCGIGGKTGGNGPSSHGEGDKKREDEHDDCSARCCKSYRVRSAMLCVWGLRCRRTGLSRKSRRKLLLLAPGAPFANGGSGAWNWVFVDLIISCSARVLEVAHGEGACEFQLSGCYEVGNLNPRQSCTLPPKTITRSMISCLLCTIGYHLRE